MRTRLWPRLIGGQLNGEKAPVITQSHLVMPVLEEINYSQDISSVVPFREEHYSKQRIAFSSADLILELLICTKDSIDEIGPKIWEELVDAGIQRAGADENEIREMAENLYDSLLAPKIGNMVAEMLGVAYNRVSGQWDGIAEFSAPYMHIQKLSVEVKELIIQAMVTMARGVKVA